MDVNHEGCVALKRLAVWILIAIASALRAKQPWPVEDLRKFYPLGYARMQMNAACDKTLIDHCKFDPSDRGFPAWRPFWNTCFSPKRSTALTAFWADGTELRFSAERLLPGCMDGRGMNRVEDGQGFTTRPSLVLERSVAQSWDLHSVKLSPSGSERLSSLKKLAAPREVSSSQEWGYESADHDLESYVYMAHWPRGILVYRGSKVEFEGQLGGYFSSRYGPLVMIVNCNRAELRRWNGMVWEEVVDAHFECP